MSNLSIDLVVETPAWDGVDLGALAGSAADAVAVQLKLPTPFECVILGCDDARIAELNADFRGKPQATNVLSWPASDLTPPDLPQDSELGDIALAFEACKSEAELAKIPFAAHLSHLIVHGILHLLGYDHIDDAQAEVMEGLEVQILAQLGLPDPYTLSKINE